MLEAMMEEVLAEAENIPDSRMLHPNEEREAMGRADAEEVFALLYRAKHGNMM